MRVVGCSSLVLLTLAACMGTPGKAPSQERTVDTSDDASDGPARVIDAAATDASGGGGARTGASRDAAVDVAASAPDAGVVDAGVIAEARDAGPPPPYATHLRFYPRNYASVDPGPNEMAFESGGFDPPPRGARVAIADQNGFLGLATVTQVFTMAHDCNACGATTRYFVARFDAPPSRTNGDATAVLPAAALPHPERLRTLSSDRPIPGLTRVSTALDLDGDGAADLAGTSGRSACTGAARVLAQTQSPCDYMHDVCAERWSRTASGWRTTERVSMGFCVMDGNR